MTGWLDSKIRNSKQMSDSLNTPHEIVGEIIIGLADYPENTSSLILEGTSDVAFWTEFKTEDCQLIPAGNKDKALDALRIANETVSLSGVVAIVDPDCWLVVQPENLSISNLLYYDVSDIEVMVFESPSLDKVLRNLMSFIPTTDAHEFARNLRQEVWRLGIEFGSFRVIGCRFPNLGLSLSKVSDAIGKHIEQSARQSLELNRESVAEALLGTSDNFTLSELLKAADKVGQENISGTRFVGGKDLMSILAHIFPTQFRRQYVDSSKYDRIDEHTLSRIKSRLQTDGGAYGVSLVLRNAYDRAYLSETGIYDRIKTWESANSPYKILKPDI